MANVGNQIPQQSGWVKSQPTQRQAQQQPITQLQPVVTPSKPVELGKGDALQQTIGTDEKKNTSMAVVTDEGNEAVTQGHVETQTTALKNVPPNVVQQEVVNSSTPPVTDTVGRRRSGAMIGMAVATTTTTTTTSSSSSSSSSSAQLPPQSAPTTLTAIELGGLKTKYGGGHNNPLREILPLLNAKESPETVKKFINTVLPSINLATASKADIEKFIGDFKNVTAHEKTFSSAPKIVAIYKQLETLKTDDTNARLKACEFLQNEITSFIMKDPGSTKNEWLHVLLGQMTAQNPMSDLAWIVGTKSKDEAIALIKGPKGDIAAAERIYNTVKQALPIQIQGEDQAILRDNKVKEQRVMQAGGDFTNLSPENTKKPPFNTINISGVEYRAPEAKIDSASSFGSVFIFTSASDPSKKVVIKAFNDQNSAMPELEAHRAAMGQVKNPNVVDIKGVIQDGNGDKYLVMECADGGASLDDVFRNYRNHSNEIPPDVDMAVKVKSIIPMVQALTHVTGSGLIHADFRPGNFFMMQDGTPKLGDFGNGRPKGDYSVNFQNEATFGNSGYFGPESVRIKSNPGTFNEAGDIYALGVSMLEILSNKSVAEIQKAGGPIAVLKSLPDDGANSAMKNICGMLLDENPGRRIAAFKNGDIMGKLDTLSRALPQVNTSKLVELTTHTKELATIFTSNLPKDKQPKEVTDRNIAEEYQQIKLELSKNPDYKGIIDDFDNFLGSTKSVDAAIATAIDTKFAKAHPEAAKAVLTIIQDLAQRTTAWQSIHADVAALGGH